MHFERCTISFSYIYVGLLEGSKCGNSIWKCIPLSKTPADELRQFRLACFTGANYPNEHILAVESVNHPVTRELQEMSTHQTK